MRTLEKPKTEEPEQIVLDSATLAAIDKAQKSFEAGEGITMKQARELNRKRYQAWLKITQDLNA